MFGFGSPFTSPSSFYRPSRYGGYSEQPPCRCPDCYYRSGAPFSSPSMSTRRPPSDYGWPFSSPYTDMYGPTDGWAAPRRRAAKPARKGGAPSRKNPSVTPEGGERAHSLQGKAKEPVPAVSQVDQDSTVQKPLETKNEQQIECTSPERQESDTNVKASSSDSESDCIPDRPRRDPSDVSTGPEEEPGTNPAMDDVIPGGDSPSPAPHPEASTLRNSTLAQIAELSELASQLKEPVVSFAGEAGSKEYLFLSESLMDVLLKLDLIESNGDKEVRDARRSAVVMIQEMLGLLESRAKGLQSAGTANGNCNDDPDDDSDADEQDMNRDEAMKGNLAEQGENEQEETLDNEIAGQEENEEETREDDIADQEENEVEALSMDEDTVEGEQEIQ